MADDRNSDKQVAAQQAVDILHEIQSILVCYSCPARGVPERADFLNRTANLTAGRSQYVSL